MSSKCLIWFYRFLVTKRLLRLAWPAEYQDIFPVAILTGKGDKRNVLNNWSAENIWFFNRIVFAVYSAAPLLSVFSLKYSQ